MNIFCHATYVGDTGYNSHSKNFFRSFSKHHNIKIRNFTVGKDWRGLHNTTNDCHGKNVTEFDKKLLYLQTLWNGNGQLEDYELYGSKKGSFEYELNIILAEANHHYFYQQYEGPKIAYTVWEATEYYKPFFEKLKEYDQIWVPSAWQAQVTINQGMPAEKVKVVPEGVDGSIFYPENYKIPGDKFRFLIFGRWDSRKSTFELIRAFKNLFGNNSKFELVISVEDSFNSDGLGSTKNRLKKFDLMCDNIRVLNFPDKQEYAKFLKAGHVYLSCSRSEGWNLPLIEAMACGTPSLYSDCSGQLEYAKGKGIPVKVKGEIPSSNFCREGEISPGNWYEPDYADLESKMIEVYNNYEYYKKKAAEDSKEIIEKFSWANAAKTANDIIEQSYGSKIERVKKLGQSNYEEIFLNNSYEKFVQVKDKDNVLDLGCSKGFFYFKHRDKNINYIGVDASVEGLSDFYQNLTPTENPTLINACVSEDKKVSLMQPFYYKTEPKLVSNLSFASLASMFSGKINFFKFDIEGSERFLFNNKENLKLIKEKVEKFSGEFHLTGNQFEKQYIYEIIRNLQKDTDFFIKLHSIDGVAIDKNFWDKLDYYSEIIVSGVVRKNNNIQSLGFVSDNANDPEAYHIINESPSLGDIIAWIPMVDKFQKEKNKKVNLYTPYGELFQSTYPNINFDYYNHQPPKGDRVIQLGTYDIEGKKWNEYNLQELAAKVLGIEFKETRPKIALPLNPKNNFQKRYVCIATQSTAQFKYWNNKDGWRKTVEYLKSLGYEVVCIDKHPCFGIDGSMNQIPDGCINKTGDLPFEDRVNDILHCDFFIGLTSGLSWLAWGLGKPVIFISGISLPSSDFSNPYRVTNTDKNLCHGCGSEAEFVFDKNNWMFCPKNKNFECTKEITFEMVKEKIDFLMASEQFEHDFSLINAEVSFKNTPYIAIHDTSSKRFLVHLLAYYGGEWVAVHEESNFLPHTYWQSFFTTRQRWRFKVYTFEGENLKLVLQETYNEKNKNIEFVLDSESSKLDKLYLEKALAFEKENNCTVFIKSKYHEKLKKEFPEFNRIFSKDQELQDIYSSYTIKRHEIENNRQNRWNTNKIWDRGRTSITFNHNENWSEYRQEEVFEDIIKSSYE
jgi:autotransporter strand-loop-strand O-heptosyltransferase